MDVCYASGTATIAGENATITNKGIASFATADFVVGSGAVNLKADVCKTIDGDAGTATAAVHNFDILGGTGISTAGANNDITITSTHASTDGSSHSLLANKTSYWSCGGSNFHAIHPDTNQIIYGEGSNNGEEFCKAEANMLEFVAPVFLPHGAIVTGAIVYGDGGATAESWSLMRVVINDSTKDSDMAAAGIGTEDTTISNATIDNSAYKYVFYTSTLDTNDRILGARITYTTDYD